MKWILVIILGASITTANFSSEKSCHNAARDLNDLGQPIVTGIYYTDFPRITAICLEDIEQQPQDSKEATIIVPNSFPANYTLEFKTLSQEVHNDMRYPPSNGSECGYKTK